MYKQVKRRKLEPKIKEEAKIKTENATREPLNINNLPTEILFEIFSHLTVSDQQTAGLVCHHWFDISTRASFLKRYVVKIQSREYREERFSKNGVIPCTMELLANSTRNFVNFDFEKIDLNLKSCGKSYQKIGASIQRLSLYKCKVNSTNLNDYLRMSPNLKELKFEQIAWIVNKGWFQETTEPLQTTITHLKWHDSEAFIAEKVFNGLTAMCPKLSSIDLSAGLQNFCSPSCMAMHLNSEASQAALGEEAFYTFLEKFAPTLRAIEIDELCKPYPYVSCLITSKLPIQLDSLILKNSKTPTIEDLNEFLMTQKSLKTLHLLNTLFNSETMKIIATMTNLQDLKLEQNCTIVGDAGIKEIKGLSKLKSLELQNLPGLTDVGFNGALLESNFDRIESLSLKSLNNITSAMFERMILKFSNLRVLKMIDASKFVTNDIMQKVFEHLVHLEELEVQDATRVSNIGFLGRKVAKGFQISRLKNLRKVSFSGMSRMNDRILKSITNNTLQSLDLSNCKNFSTNGVKALLAQCPSLEILKLNGNPQISPRILYYALNQTTAPRIKDIMLKCTDPYCHC